MVAIQTFATALVSKTRRADFSRSGLDRLAAPGRCRLTSRAIALFAAALLVGEGAASGASNKVRISSLTDVGFGTVTNLNVDALQSQSVCIYADTTTSGYNVTANGTGPGGAFQLSSGAASMPFDVLWSSSAGQNSGAQLTPNVALAGQVSSATHQTCNNGPATSASLVVVLRSSALSSATAGAYNGTLTLIVGPE